MYDSCTNAWAYYFVASAPAYLGLNLKASLGIANGTPCVLHSLAIDPNVATAEQSEEAYLAASPVDFVEIPIPHTVNVQLEGSIAQTWTSGAPTVGNAHPPVLPGRGKKQNSG